MKTTTLTSYIGQNTKKSLTSVSDKVWKTRKRKIISFWLIVIAIWGITAGVGFSEVVRINSTKHVYKYGLNNKDIFYYKYAYLNDKIEPVQDYALGQMGKNTILNTKVDGFDNLIMGMKKGDRRIVSVTFPSSSSKFPNKTKKISIKILEIVEKNGYHNPNKEIENGDIAIFDYKGLIDGEPFAGGSSKYATLVIGSKKFIPGFEKQMIGLKEGQHKDIKLTFPKDYQKTSLAGVDAVFEIFLRTIVKKDEL